MIASSSLLLSAALLFFGAISTVTARNQLGQATSLSTPRFTCRLNEALLEIFITTDGFPLDTSWMVVERLSGRILDFANEGSYPLPNTQYSKAVCLRHGQQYQFLLLDSHGDGLCCGHGNGGYRLELEGQEIYSGGQFALSVEHTFTVSADNGGSAGPPPTPNPTPAPVQSTTTSFDDSIVHPHCNPNSGSYNPSSDQTSGCSPALCARDGSVHKWEYDAAETMLDRCFATCAQRVGLDAFCSLTEPPPNGSPAMPYCDSEGQNSAWTAALNAKENQFVTLLNQQRAAGYSCPTQYFPPVPPVKRNPQLDCAARAQARKIVDYSTNIGFNNNSPSLHRVCDFGRGNCDSFSERIEKAGYTEWWGYIGENANWGYTTAQGTLEGWSDSSGHCPLLMKQDWAHVLVEIGIGYYEDPNSGSASWVMVGAQR